MHDALRHPSRFQQAQALADRLKASARAPGDADPPSGGEDLDAWRSSFHGDVEAEAAWTMRVLKALVHAFRDTDPNLLQPPASSADVEAWETAHDCPLPPWFRRCLVEVTAGYAQRTETTAFDLAWPGFGPQRPSGAVGRALDAALDTLEAGTTHEVLVPLDITASAVPAEPARTWIALLSEDDGQNGVFVTALLPSGPLADQVVSIDPASVVRDVDFALDPDTEALVDALGAYVETGVSRRGHVVPYLVRFVREQVLGEDVLGEDVLGEDVW